jgi:hypothetical protein
MRNVLPRGSSALTASRGLGIASGLLGLAAAIYACSSSSNGSTPPPLNDSGTVTDSSMSGDSSSNSDAPSSGDGETADAGTPLCSSLPGAKVYIQSADTQETVLDIVGREMRDSANITLVFLLTGSCTVVPETYAGTPIPKNTNMLYIPSTAENPTYNPETDPEYNCVTDPNTTTPQSLGISALFPSSCPGAPTPPAGMANFIGPIQAYTFVVPTAEFTGGQNAISADEAYYAFGDGANNPVTWNGAAEWNVPSQFYLRPSSKSTLVSTALNIGLTAAQMTLAEADGGTADGRQLLASSGDVVTAVTAATSSQAIGILGSEVYDTDRGKGINVLAFSGFGQTSQYFPDSTSTSFDKQNIRNGNYTLWSPAVIMTAVDGSGNPSDPNVKFFTDIILGNQSPVPPNGYVDGGKPIDGLGATVSAGLTPNCAMQVQRSADGAPVTPYTPPAPCTCYFLSQVPMAAALPASCIACSASSPCATGSCFNGYCETTPPPSVTATQITKTGLVFPTTDGGLLPPNP